MSEAPRAIGVFTEELAPHGGQPGRSNSEVQGRSGGRAAHDQSNDAQPEAEEMVCKAEAEREAEEARVAKLEAEAEEAKCKADAAEREVEAARVAKLATRGPETGLKRLARMAAARQAAKARLAAKAAERMANLEDVGFATQAKTDSHEAVKD